MRQNRDRIITTAYLSSIKLTTILKSNSQVHQIYVANMLIAGEIHAIERSAETK